MVQVAAVLWVKHVLLSLMFELGQSVCLLYQQKMGVKVRLLILDQDGPLARTC